ncbi:MAG: hypothetical protein LBN01_01870 [Endomicrobium sp.]|nr:hypothetical protein [Endomicrobium sp.]
MFPNDCLKYNIDDFYRKGFRRMKKVFVVFMMFINLVAVSACKPAVTNITLPSLPEIKLPIQVNPAPVSLPVDVKEITVNAVSIPMNLFFIAAICLTIYKFSTSVYSDYNGKKVTSLAK